MPNTAKVDRRDTKDEVFSQALIFVQEQLKSLDWKVQNSYTEIRRTDFEPVIAQFSRFRTDLPDIFGDFDIREFELTPQLPRGRYSVERLKSYLQVKVSLLESYNFDLEPSSESQELDFPQKVTLSWLYKHAPISWWFIFLGLLCSAFMLGVNLSDTPYINALDI